MEWSLTCSERLVLGLGARNWYGLELESPQPAEKEVPGVRPGAGVRRGDAGGGGELAGGAPVIASTGEDEQHCGQPSLATEALSSSSSSGLKFMIGKLLCCQSQLESLQPGKEKMTGDQPKHLWFKIDPRTPAVEKKIPDEVKGFESPVIELAKGNEAEKMAHKSDPSHSGSSSRKTIPFVKRSVLWKTIESMETFHKMPQNPCFRQLEKLTEWNREGAAIALMVSFGCLVRRVGKLCISDSQSSFSELLQSLVTFEENGFDVGCIRSRIKELLEIRNNGKQFKEKRPHYRSSI